MHIAVAGNIGSGKTTLTGLLAKHFAWEPQFEEVDDNPYLNDFYDDMQRWSFNLQVYFLNKRFNQIIDIRESGRSVIQDRTIYEDAEVFAANLHRRKLINKRDWQMYRELYETILTSLRPPDLMIYLKAPLRTIVKRIKLRGRPEEQTIPTSYLKALNVLYDEWFAGYKRSPVIVLETDKLDYLSDLVHRIDVLKTIEKYIR